jgi:hypothetical protein
MLMFLGGCGFLGWCCMQLFLGFCFFFVCLVDASVYRRMVAALVAPNFLLVDYILGGCLFFYNMLLAKSAFTQQQPGAFAGDCVLVSASVFGCWVFVQ